ncbi:putative DNA-binding transcriptional regulator YafY [Azospirillum fermentarium]|uniref:helix-turn-helix transcriptional regulator n=1 Tax=Azospirillum fermentarium TaxID=1233114 RepID=UPI0022273A0B|nr:YafY family protein [Azospirillum fermentarium]MCW2244929.1 putative DNA-binding transcriptional regulator YafY [Azospirillum fermentarium]
MSRAERLLDLLQVLRRHRRPVRGAALADELGVSLRTLYRDIATLQAQGARIEGEAGVGYVLRPGFLLPPLMFTVEEIEALVLGSRWVADRADGPLGDAARAALTKIAAVLPDEVRASLDSAGLFVPPRTAEVIDRIDVSAIRRAIRQEHALTIAYSDKGGAATERTIWPMGLAFFDNVRVVIAWCVLRQGFRHFRTDRIAHLTDTGTRYPRRRATLLKEWKAAEGAALPALDGLERC